MLTIVVRERLSSWPSSNRLSFGWVFCDVFCQFRQATADRTACSKMASGIRKHENDENCSHVCLASKKGNTRQRAVLAVKVCAGGLAPITALADNACCGVLRPQGPADELLQQLTAVQQQLCDERKDSTRLQGELQHVKDQLSQFQAQLAEASSEKAELQQQLSTMSRQLQRARRSAETSESARVKAAVDCNRSAGIALRRLQEVQQLKQVVQQQAEQLASMQQALVSLNAQLIYSRQLHAHIAALLSMRDMQLADALQQPQGSVPASASTSPVAKQRAQQHPENTEAAAMQSAPHSVAHSHCETDTSSVAAYPAAAGSLQECSNSECSIIASKPESDIQGDEAEGGTGTPVAHHPGRPVFDVREYKGSRLSLVDDFDRAAAAADTQQPALDIKPAGQLSEVLEDVESDSSRGCTQSVLKSYDSSSKGLRRMLKHKTTVVLQALRTTAGLRRQS